VERDEKGIPRVNAVMQMDMRTATAHAMLCQCRYESMMADLMQSGAASSRQVKDFLLVGQRWDLDQTSRWISVETGSPGCCGSWLSGGKFYSPWGIDYFVFPYHLYTIGARISPSDDQPG